KRGRQRQNKPTPPTRESASRRLRRGKTGKPETKKRSPEEWSAAYYRLAALFKDGAAVKMSSVFTTVEEPCLQREKVRVYALARELNVESKDLLDLCKQLGFDVKNQLS